MLAWLRDPRQGGLLVLALIIALLPLVLPNRFYFDVAILIGINAIAVVGLNLLIGYAGQISLGHAGFFGIGAYAVTVLPSELGVPSWLAFLIGIACVGLLAFLVGRPILRLKGHYLAVATLGMGILIFMVVTNESQWTGGPDGMSVARLTLSASGSGRQTWYWIAGAALLLGVWLALNLIDSPSGGRCAPPRQRGGGPGRGHRRRQLQGLRLRGLGVYASLAGSISAIYTGFVTPDGAGFLHSIELVTMVVLGGMASTFGGIVGAAHPDRAAAVPDRVPRLRACSASAC